MALAHRQRNQAGDTAASTTAAVTFGSTTLAGSLLILLTSAAGATHNAPTDSAGNTWVQAGVTDEGSLSNYKSIWYCKNALANAGTVTMNYGGSYIYRDVVIYEITGADDTAPFIESLSADAGASPTATTANFTISQESIIVALTTGTPSITGGTGFTGNNHNITGDANNYFLDQYKIVTADTPATSTDGGTGSGILGASFKAGAGATVTPWPFRSRFMRGKRFDRKRRAA